MIPGPARLPGRGFDLALVAGLLALLAPFAWSSAWRPDELSQLANAARMLGGEVLYRDYFEILAPGSLWLAAGVFAVTGPSLLAARVVVALAVALAGWLACRLVLALGAGRAAGALAAVGLVLGSFRAFPVWGHHWIALPLALGAALLAVRGVAAPRGRGWLAVGALAGACTMVTQSDGLALFAGLALAIALLGALGAWTGAEARAAALRLLAGAGAALAAVALPLLATGTLDDAWRCAWSWPAAHYRAAGGVNDALFGHDLGWLLSPANGPWPGRAVFFARLYHLGLAYALPVLAAAAALAWALGLAARRLRGQAATPAQGRWGVVAVLVLAFGAVAVRGRADHVHVAFYLPWTLVLAAAAADGLRGLLRPAAGLALAGLPLGALALFAATGGVLAAHEARTHPDDWLAATSPDARLAAHPLVRYVKAHTRPGDRVVELPQGGLAYFFARPSAADMNVMLPPRFRYTDEDDYRALWARIAERRPALILVTPDHPVEAELAEHLRHPLPGYERAAVVAAPAFDGPRKTWVFRRKP